MTDEVAPVTAEVVEVKPDDHYVARKAARLAARNPAAAVEAKVEPAQETPKAEETTKPAETAPAETAETKTETAAETGETETKTEPQGEDAAAKRKQRRTLEEENYRLRQKNRELRDMVDTRGSNGDSRAATPQIPPQPETAKRPKQEDFQDYEAYQEALIDWKADAKLQDFQARQLRAQSESQMQRDVRAKAERFGASADKVRTEHEDFDEVVFSEDLIVTPVMRAIVDEADEPAELAYYLGKHPDEARRIAQMSPPKAAMELGRIEDRLKPTQTQTAKPAATNPKRETNAPPPPKVVTGGNARASTDMKTLNQDDYYAQRKANFRSGVR